MQVDKLEKFEVLSMNRFDRASKEYSSRKAEIQRLYAQDPGSCVAMFTRRKAAAEQGADVPVCALSVTMNMLWVVLVGIAAAMVASGNADYARAGFAVASLGVVLFLFGLVCLVIWSQHKRTARAATLLDEQIMREEGYIR